MCLADIGCKAFETAHEDITALYTTDNFPSDSKAINCCIEYVALSDFQNPVSKNTASGMCQKEAKCWSTHEVTGTCSAIPAYPAECVRSSGTPIHKTSTEIQSVKDWMANGCEYSDAGNAVLNATTCFGIRTHGSRGSQCE